VRIAIVFVDFSNAPKQGSSDSYFDRIATKVIADYREMSYGKLNVEFVTVSDWIRMEKPSASYNVSQAGRKDYSDTVAYAQEVIRKTDPKVDFTGVSSIAIFAAEEAAGISGDYAQPLVDSLSTKELSSIDSVIVTGGGWWLNDWDATTVTHEIGHVLGLADLYDPDPDAYSPYVGDFDLMSVSSTSSLAPSMFGWNRWRLGWISDDAVVCVKPTSENRITLSPIQSGKGALLAVVPLSATRALVMESRHPVGMDSKLPTSGVLVYIVDTRVESTKGPIKVVGEFTVETMSDVLLGVGEYLEASGWVVSVTRNEVWGNEFAIFP
jgi:M6 family metalloprotease-like protein